ncbi:vitamin B12 dependent methionine synthase activation domain [Eubacterium sp. CAG:786]|nr:vitamin B12 dependent methionine synthase activation domain [Eubacterium sp. CAG:786]
MTSEITQINRAEALRYMGYTEEPDARISAVIDECEQELLKEARPQYVWRVFSIIRSGHELFLSDCDFMLEGKDIAEHLRGCDKAAVLCSTLSSDTDRYLKKLDVSDSMKAVITDALANAMIEQVNENARQDILANMPGYSTTWCYGAGYGDFPIECAPLLIASVDAVRKIGVCCTATNMLTPRKTIIGVVGLFRGELEKKRRSCEDCNAKDTCKYRAYGTRC